MKKQVAEQVTSGQHLVNTRNGMKFLVEDINRITKKFVILNLETQEEKEVALATLLRNYELDNDQEVKQETKVEELQATEEVAEDKVEEKQEAKQEHVSVPRPKKSEKEKEPKRRSVALESLDKLRSDLEKRIKEEFDAERKVTTQYIGYKAKRNFIEIHQGATSLYVLLRPNLFNQAQLDSLTKLFPEKHGWALSAKYSILTDKDVEEVMELVKLSYLNAEGITSVSEIDNSEEEESK